jgi:hypothetical protein
VDLMGRGGSTHRADYSEGQPTSMRAPVGEGQCLVKDARMEGHAAEAPSSGCAALSLHFGRGKSPAIP